MPVAFKHRSQMALSARGSNFEAFELPPLGAPAGKIRRRIDPDAGDDERRKEDKEVAAFPGRRLRHFQKQGSVKEELNRSGGRVQVQLKLTGAAASK